MRSKSAPTICPSNQKFGKPVDSLTIKALLAVTLARVSSTDYYFCPDETCPVVYYSVDGTQVFEESDLRERVYQKHSAASDVFVCYCFRHTIGGIERELQQAGTTNVIDDINAGIQAGQCACDIRNPQGSCCLGNVRLLVRRLQNKI